VLIGPPGAGKSTVAAALAQRWQLEPRDTDTDVETTAGKSVADVFVEDGEPHFRELERAAVAAALDEHDGVLALGGGAVLDPGTRVLLQAYREGGLRDATVFNAEEGAAWTTADGRTRQWPEWRDWLGRRASAGKLAPKGFPATKRFRPK